ncbi:nuclease-related domain-containing protein [Virgibacillus salinus]|uniref:Nuclease-related domain-containing protein n=1 Tax=Virgibacillus salinus TaxID=553311 RepID=A0A1H0YEZ2_9BACI|nr:nuclease-related domain-containing protein [Virgibacillus salinus]SDQ13702.1 Nuclease-related domain-containing protein [Virgibacillus salinus]
MVPLSLKNRFKNYDLLAYEAVFRQLLEDYWKSDSIISAYKKEKAGYDGEKNVDYKLSTYPQKDLIVFQGIRLPNPPFYFQIDTLILTRNLIYILEVKNYQGKFQYDSKLQQLTQEVDGKATAYKDPILQAEAQKTHLQQWLEKHGIYNVPIETLVVIAFPSTIIENIHQDPEVYKKIIHSESLHQHLNRLSETHTKNILTAATIRKLTKALLHEDQPLHTNILDFHNLSDQHLIKGVPCEKCNHSSMLRLYKKWLCPKCKATAVKAHERKILDYFLLHGDTISNKQCRELLQVGPRTAYTILNSMNLSHKGSNSARKYYSPSLNEFPQNSYLPTKMQRHIKLSNSRIKWHHT